MTEIECVDNLQKQADAIQAKIDVTERSLLELKKDLHAIKRAIRIVTEKKKDVPEKHFCRECENLRVTKCSTRSGKARGDGMCAVCHSGFWNKTFNTSCTFSKLACPNFVPRTSPLEVGYGGGIPDFADKCKK